MNYLNSKKSKLIKATLSISLVMATLAGATTVYAKGSMFGKEAFYEELNLSQDQIAQLEAYHENKKAERMQRSEAQKEADRVALSEFLTDEQVEAIMAKHSKGEGKRHFKKGGMKKNHKASKNILNYAEALELTQNQIVQIQTIIDEHKAQKESAKETEEERPSKEQMQAKREELKAQIQAVLTDAQIEKLESLRSR